MVIFFLLILNGNLFYLLCRWGLIVALIISAVFLPFVVTVYAITGERGKHVFFLFFGSYMFCACYRFRTEHPEPCTGKLSFMKIV